ncbi:respiratory-chain NADH dehydrogenase subunit 1 [Solidesulfovibrio fructosivorans JJ]]|uniref:Respiratory-chain NADH dehydrogenase subunit 1 n=1 Tax=Solidesulfovibrio fructosivorans JJ] TaxID=596151 RepID=E1JZ54_SOLFR|nr:respiratory-chain NADH dehydrogenase subunit 1 [Solidesulfovibrio fructosivorans JJ]]
MIIKIIIAIAALVLAPIAGALITGVDRRVTAWLQSRYGPPILQPLYDVFKLLGKEPMLTNTWQAICAYVYVTGAALSVMLLFMGSDLLLIFFVLTVGAVFLVMGALASPSPYSQVGGQRELLQMLAYEPLLILVFAAIAMVTGSFKVSAVFGLERPLLYDIPLMFIVLGYALTIKLRKSPFDISASQHAHQELVRGVYTEYSGPYLAMVEIAHWYEVILILGLCALFWSTSVVGMIVLVVLTYLAEIIVDNVTARLTWRFMLKSAVGMGVVLTVINMLWLYAQ